MAKAFLNESDEEFNDFVKAVLALPHVPLADLQETINIIETKNWEFEHDLDKAAFKEKFLNHIQQYWVDGPIPPQVWNCFRRKVDLTNNNNEAYNNYLNNAIKETHPSPATFVVAIVKELTMAETTLRKVKNGGERVIQKPYRLLNRRRKNVKKLYTSLNRLEYLSKIGNIVMAIQLNKGQMAEVEARKEREVRAEEESEVDSDDESEEEVQNNPPISDLEESSQNYDSSEQNVSLENETKSSIESNNPYGDRVLGRAGQNGRQEPEYQRSEFKGKRCLSCNGKFTKQSKYQICKLCDKLTHVNNKKKCLKMKEYKKDDDFICKHCENNESSIEGYSTNDELPSINGNEEGSMNREEEGYSSSDGVPLMNDGVPSMNGDEEEVPNMTLNRTYSITYYFPCDYCNFEVTRKEDLPGHVDQVHVNHCPICEENFLTGDAMRDHIEVAHENDNQNDQSADYFSNLTIDGFPCDGLIVSTVQDFNSVSAHPDKQSSMKRSKKLLVAFVGAVPDMITNIKKRNKGN